MEVEDSGRDLRERIRSQVEDSRSSQREGLRATKRPFLSEVVEGLTLLSSEELKSLALSLKNKISLVEGLTVVTHFVQVTREALQRISASASLSQKHIDAVLSVDAALPTLIGYLSGDDAGMQLESAACITNLVCGNHKSTIRVARAAGPYLLLYAHSSHSHTLQVQCLWAVGNISRDCDKCCRLLSQQGFQSAITSSLPLVSIQEEEGDDSLSATLLFALSGFLHSASEADRRSLDLESLRTMLSQMTQKSCIAAYRCLFYMTCDDVFDSAYPPHLFSLCLNWLSHHLIEQENTSVEKVTLLLRILANLVVCSSQVITQATIDQSAFLILVRALLSSPYLHLQKETQWLLGNLLHREVRIWSEDLSLLLEEYLPQFSISAPILPMLAEGIGEMDGDLCLSCSIMN